MHHAICYMCLALCYSLHICIHCVLLHPHTSPVTEEPPFRLSWEQWDLEQLPNLQWVGGSWPRVCLEAQGNPVPLRGSLENRKHLRNTMLNFHSGLDCSGNLYSMTMSVWSEFMCPNLFLFAFSKQEEKKCTDKKWMGCQWTLWANGCDRECWPWPQIKIPGLPKYLQSYV